MTKVANFIATELVPDAHRGDYDHAMDVVTQERALPQFDVAKHNFCRGDGCVWVSLTHVCTINKWSRAKQMVACTTGDLNSAVRGSRPRVTLDCRLDGSRERCAVCAVSFLPSFLPVMGNADRTAAWAHALCDNARRMALLIGHFLWLVSTNLAPVVEGDMGFHKGHGL